MGDVLAPAPRSSFLRYWMAAYWQALTPDELLGRVNATRRSINRTTAALGALVAGLLVGLIGDCAALIGVVIAFAAAALTAALSPLRQQAPNRD